MKKIICFSLLFMLILTGCSSFSFVRINEDGSVSYEYTILLGVENFATEEAREQVINEIKKDLDGSNIDYIDIENEDEKGVKVVLDFKSIEDMLLDSRLNKFILAPKMYFKTYYDESTNEGICFEKEDNIFKVSGRIGADTIRYVDDDPESTPSKVTFTLSLPNEALTHNAKIVSVDKKDLTWEYTGEDVPIEVSFSLDESVVSTNNSSSIIAIIIVAFFILLVLAIGVFVFIKKKKKNN